MSKNGNLINASDEDKTTDEEEKGTFNYRNLEFRKAKLLFKTLVLTNVFFVDFL